MKRVLTPALVLLISAAAVAQQTGDSNRDFVINGNGAGGTSPVTTNVFVGGDLELDYSTLDASAPLLLAAAPVSTNNWAPGLSANSVDLGPAGINILVDGTSALDPLGPYFRTTSSGSFRFSVSIPDAFQGTSTFMTALHLSPASPDGFYIGQVHGVTFNAPFCDPAAQNLNLGDDDSAIVNLGFSFPFYGSTYSDIEIWSNGSIVVGPVGGYGGGFNFDPASFLSTGAPEMAVLATDLDPSSGGSVNFISDQVATAQICWNDVPEYYVGGSNTFRATISSGTITYDYVGIDAGSVYPGGYAYSYSEVLVGLSPGSNLLPGVAIDLNAPGGSVFAAPDAPYEYWAYVPNDLSNLSVTWLMDSNGNPIAQL